MMGHVKEDHVCAFRSFMYRSCIGHVVSCRCIDLGVVHVVRGMYVLVKYVVLSVDGVTCIGTKMRERQTVWNKHTYSIEYRV